MQDFSNEIFYKTSRSGGKGGQNVNKVETQAEAYWHVANSSYFNDEEKERIALKLSNRMNSEGSLMVKCSETRSQLENKEIAHNKLLALVEKSLIIPVKRKASKPSKTAIENRLQSKKKESEKKEIRKKRIDFGE